MRNNRRLKAFVRYDGSGRLIPGGPIFGSSKPKVGNWKEISVNQCCNSIDYNFDITANWSLTTPKVVGAASFKMFLESGEDNDGNVNSFTDVVITDFNLVDGRLRCNLTANAGPNELFGLAGIDVSQVLKIGNISGDFDLYLYENSLTTFNPIAPLPEGLTTLNLHKNALTEFNPSLPLPSILANLYLSENQLTDFNPSLPLPESLSELFLDNNEMTTAGYTASETWANGMHDAPVENRISFNGNLDSVAGTNLETILVGKGWDVIAV